MKLPNKVEMTDNDLSQDLLEILGEEMNEYLSNKYGFITDCCYEIKIKITDIEWDTTDDDYEDRVLCENRPFM